MTAEQAKKVLDNMYGDWRTDEEREALEVAIMAMDVVEVWNGIHGQVVAPKGTFDRIWEDEDEG